ncbi:MAG: hypothetical protein E6H08_16925 [Bacteroidetes bacterium]|nr:MAG: hypothetical protein E6H08_16925 [Bacteroidota bacterium]
MLKTIYITVTMLLSYSNCSNRTDKQEVNCGIIDNVIKYLNENEKEFKNKSVAVFDTTDALPFTNFRQEIQLHYPSIGSQIIDSLDHNAKPQKIDCKSKEGNSKIEVIFSNIYKNLIICEWFYAEGSSTQNINDMRRFKEAKNYLFELGADYKIKQVFIKTVQYE